MHSVVFALVIMHNHVPLFTLLGPLKLNRTRRILTNCQSESSEIIIIKVAMTAYKVSNAHKPSPLQTVLFPAISRSTQTTEPSVSHPAHQLGDAKHEATPDLLAQSKSVIAALYS